MPREITDFEIIDHGIENSQYFQGCGVSLTSYEYVSTGCGNDFQEAIDDALESMAQCEETNGVDFVTFEQAIKDQLGIKTVSWPQSDTVPEDAEECYYYVSIRYNVHDHFTGAKICR